FGHPAATSALLHVLQRQAVRSPSTCRRIADGPERTAASSRTPPVQRRPGSVGRRRLNLRCCVTGSGGLYQERCLPSSTPTTSFSADGRAGWAEVFCARRT